MARHPPDFIRPFGLAWLSKTRVFIRIGFWAVFIRIENFARQAFEYIHALATAILLRATNIVAYGASGCLSTSKRTPQQLPEESRRPLHPATHVLELGADAVGILTATCQCFVARRVAHLHESTRTILRSTADPSCGENPVYGQRGRPLKGGRTCRRLYRASESRRALRIVWLTIAEIDACLPVPDFNGGSY
ncbi:hypothetical protein B0H10DRAFT_1943489 [Mycena sp. CBHHK59/15]|nr:hypothetical protein B0H10DRAFT_1943489 [Mycena sp. CBHHK59/15]